MSIAVDFDRARLRRDVVAAYDAGLCVLPVATDGTKRPAANWKEYRRAARAAKP